MINSFIIRFGVPMISGIVFLSCYAMASPTFKVKLVSSPKSVLGEGPHWDADSQSLYYNDIYGTEFSILRYDLSENKTYGATIDGEPVVSFIIPVAGTTDQFAVGIGRRVGIVQWDGKSPKGKLLRIALEVEHADEFKENRFNDAKADPTGRLYAGTMRKEDCGDLFKLSHGALYTFAANESVTTLRDPVRISNGLAWNEKKNKFYFIDSCDLNVKEFNYDPATGSISNERVVISFSAVGEEPKFVPDGMTIDSEGYLYVATWGGSKVIKINPTNGNIEFEIPFPCKQVTSAAFGGKNLDILYVTTASQARTEQQSEKAGYLFQVTGLGAKGSNGVKVRL